VNEAAEVIYDLVDPTANLIFGAVIDPRLGQEVGPLFKLRRLWTCSRSPRCDQHYRQTKTYVTGAFYCAPSCACWTPAEPGAPAGAARSRGKQPRKTGAFCVAAARGIQRHRGESGCCDPRHFGHGRPSAIGPGLGHHRLAACAQVSITLIATGFGAGAPVAAAPAAAERRAAPAEPLPPPPPERCARRAPACGAEWPSGDRDAQQPAGRAFLYTMLRL